jgi:hypothetical protein
MVREAEPTVSSVVRELYHYTSLAGLEGITSSQYLRATRYDHLNDSSELEHFRAHVIEAMTRVLYDRMRKASKAQKEVRRYLTSVGGERFASRTDARTLINNFYEVTFVGSTDHPPFATPYILSFCSHTEDDKYIRQNGLLSQWRAYGASSGRFALVLDAKKLEGMLEEESTRYYYSFLSLCDTVYNDERLEFAERFSKLLQYLSTHWEQHIRETPQEAEADAFNEFIRSAARFKHQAFREEREYRVIACPMSPILRDFFVERLGYADPQESQIRGSEMDERNRPYVPLLRGSTRPLPIKRIIVGPHPRQRELASQARRITKGLIDICLSATPYLDRA